jgi:hypothetical protein
VPRPITPAQLHFPNDYICRLECHMMHLGPMPIQEPITGVRGME